MFPICLNTAFLRRFYMTIYDISKKAGVSIATVSRVLNGSGKVSEKTKEKVLAVMGGIGVYPQPLCPGAGVKYHAPYRHPLRGFLRPVFG